MARKRPSSNSNRVRKLDRQPTEFEERLYKVREAFNWNQHSHLDNSLSLVCHLQVTRCIKKGKVTTYGVLAKLTKSSARAVGGAMKRNPYAPEVPCHRVVAADLSIGGFFGSSGLNSPEVMRKRRLLMEEGVTFDQRGKIDPSNLMTAQDLTQSLLTWLPKTSPNPCLTNASHV